MSPPPPAPEGQQFPLNFLTTVLVVTLQQVYLYDPLYLALSGVTLPLHQHFGPFTTIALLLRDGALFTPVRHPIGGSEWSVPALCIVILTLKPDYYSRWFLKEGKLPPQF